MSLINQMLKDLEKRRSRDLETSDTLSHNITWETPPNQKSFNWLAASVIFTLVALMSVIGFLVWERTNQPAAVAVAAKPQPAAVKKPVKKVVATKKVKPKPEPVVAKAEREDDYNDLVNTDDAVDVEELDDSPVVSLKKKNRPLNSKQLAEIAYQKGYKLLQQGRVREGKENLREALNIYIPHIKAREMLAGLYIRSGHLISAAELLSEGVKIAPDYPLFAKLYARVLLEQNNPALAIQILKRGSAAADINAEPDYYALLAATYQRVNQHQNAVDIYLQLVKIRPAAGVWWLGLGLSLEKSGKNKAALEAYQRAQKTGSLKAGLVKFTNNRVAALSEIGYPQ